MSPTNTMLQSFFDKVDPRGARLWGPGYLRAMRDREATDPELPLHLYVCVADHFEPRWRNATPDDERRRVGAWTRRYPPLARRHRDSFGRPHVRTLFFPIEEYRREHLDALRALVDQGLVDVEVHLHHDADTRENLRASLLGFTETLHRDHGLLRRDPDTGILRYAFIHGNWALDNSHPGGLFCGVDDEISLLVETGCYLDMTMPCVPSPAQGRVVNTLYYARGAPGRSRGHDRGREVYVGGSERPGELMLIPGPLGLHWASRARGIAPRIEAAMLEPENPVPLAHRVACWEANAPAVRGAPNHRFVKLHAHGCNGDAPEWFLRDGGPFDQLLTLLEERWSDGHRRLLHYVTAREMYETVKSLEDGSRVVG